MSPLENPVWRKNLGALPRFRLSFDLQVFPQQMAQALTVVREHPNLQFILVHTGQPIAGTPKAWSSGGEACAR